MRLFSSRQLKNRLYILKQKHFKLSTVLKFTFILAVIFLIMPLFLVLIVYSGYQKKLINNIDNIPDELSTAVLISDQNKDNLKYLVSIANEAYQKRKINFVYIYLLGSSKEIKDEELIKDIDKVPSAEIKINRDYSSPFDICNSSKDLYNLSKFIVISFEDTAVRTTFICNNLNIFSLGITPAVNETELSIQTSGFIDRLNDINKVFLGFELPVK